MSTGYVPIVVLGAVAALFAILSIVASALLRPRRPTVAKTEPYESGVRPVRLPAGERFHVKFYVVAMLFIIFDIETIFLFPWAVSFRSLGLFGLIEMAVFIGLVFIAYVYIWRKGGFDWGASEVAPNEAEEVVERERALFTRSEQGVAKPPGVDERQGAGRAG